MHRRDGRATVAAGGVLTPALARVFGASLGGLSGFFLLLPVVPLYASAAGGGTAGAGLATGVLLFATVAAELVTPRLVGWAGPRLAFGAGLVLLGAPALVLAGPEPAGTGGLALILAVSAARGLGFGLVVVLGSALVAGLVPAQRRGEGLGLYGVVVGVPGVVALPLGVFLVGQVGFGPVFVAGALAPLAGLALLPGLAVPPTPPPAGMGGPVGIRAGLRMPGLVRPAAGFAVTATAAGVVVSFVPLAVTGGAGGLAAAGLLAQAASATAARWWAGRYGDRRGPARLLVPAVLAATAGMLGMVLVAHPVPLLAGLVLFGAGFGVSQNASLALMFSRVGPAGYGTVSALWNLGYDLGMGLGAAGFGVLVALTGYPAGFAVTGLLILVALVPVGWDRRASRAAA